MADTAVNQQTNYKQRLILVDGSGYIFRAFHGLPPLTRRDGTPVGAVYGYTTMLLRLRETYKHDMLAVIFDAGRQTFRSEIFPQYKMNRSETPEDLIPQFPLVREATRALNIPAIELENYEADDLIASYAHAARAEGREVVIVSSDKDLMQLIVDDEITMMDPMKNKTIGSAQVMEKFGVMPDKVIEVQALIGDSVDNVPGVPSIGPKTAAELINQFGDLEGVLRNLESIKQPKRREVLTTHADNARLSRVLVELKCDIPLPEPLSALETKPFDSAALAAFLERQNFTSLAKRVSSLHSPVASDGATSAVVPPPIGGRLGGGLNQALHFQGSPPPILPPIGGGVALASTLAPLQTAYETITDEAALLRWIADASTRSVIAIDTETTSLNAAEAELVGISLGVEAGRACYIPLQHVSELGAAVTSQSSLFDAPVSAEKKLVAGQLPLSRALELLAPLLTNLAVLKIGHNIKYDLVVLDKYDVAIGPIGDTMLMSYCTSGGLHAQGLDFVVERHLGHKMIAFADVCGSGKNQKNFSEIPLDVATNYAAEDADFTLRLYEALAPQLVQSKVTRVYETIERPLIPVIVAMECAGIKIDTGVLGGLSSQFGVKIDALEKEIIALAGMPFSVGSPKQLGEVLYDKLQLGGAKKSSKTGAYTTDAQTLETLAEEGHAIAAKVLEWRQYSKLRSTYTDALPRAISARDGRVHTSYAMALTTTGRLSSSEPNLQNIPIRTEEGRRIRSAFVAPEGFTLLSADYSQIELRLLAHMANMDSLKQAFREGVDIHALTASQMFGVPLDQMTSDIRRRAKAINFGIIYGISAHGLSVQLGISRAEAADYIAKYFEQYPGIREYMDTTIQFARAHGYVETLYGRRVHVRDINSKNGAFRQFSERAAINAPLQGTAADIIKLAMVEVQKVVASRQSPVASKARMLLQVHDELVIEVPIADADALAREVKRAMEGAASLSVPLTVEVGQGLDWGSAH
ncbi:MAG: DNA polymerase I [Rickettsiales bacterium]|nr:DNA polymerase I [Rickettsiales bacterium]